MNLRFVVKLSYHQLIKEGLMAFKYLANFNHISTIVAILDDFNNQDNLPLYLLYAWLSRYRIFGCKHCREFILGRAG
jgi:hypothetical protein